MSNRPNEVWVDDPAPGGWICGVCLYPVESEPCEQHDGAALTDEQLERLALERSLAQALAEVASCDREAWRGRALRAEARLAAVASLAGEFADSGCIHLNTMWGRLRAALDGEASR